MSASSWKDFDGKVGVQSPDEQEERMDHPETGLLQE